MIADLKKFWDTQIVLGENFKGFDPKNATYGDLKTDEQPFGVEGYILDETDNKNVQRPIMSQIAIELETFSNDLQKRVVKLKELLEVERANLEDEFDNSPYLARGGQTRKEAREVAEMVAKNKLSKAS